MFSTCSDSECYLTCTGLNENKRKIAWNVVLDKNYFLRMGFKNITKNLILCTKKCHKLNLNGTKKNFITYAALDFFIIVIKSGESLGF